MRRNRGRCAGWGPSADTYYILWTTRGAFLVVLGSLTAVIWVTQAVCDIGLVTSQGQAIFIGITGRIIRLRIAPSALSAISLGCYRCNTPRWSPPANRFNVLTEHITQRLATS
jgi:hypothetical protein